MYFTTIVVKYIKKKVQKVYCILHITHDNE